jgi:hypothetical protein
MTGTRDNLDRRRIVGGFLFGYACTAFIIFLILVEWWAHHAPVTPNYLSGQIFPHNEHGWITYFTSSQSTEGAILFGSSWLSGAGAMITLPKRNVLVRRLGRVPVAARWKIDDPSEKARGSALCGALAAPAIALIFIPAVAWLNRNGVVFNF